MSGETPYSRPDNFTVVDPVRAGREDTPGTTVSGGKPVDEVNYKVGAGVLTVALTGLGVFLFNALGPLWMVAGGAGGAAVAYGAHRVKTGASDARHRRRMGIGRPRRRGEGVLGRAVRAHTARTPKLGRAGRVKMPARAAARTAADARPGLRERLKRWRNPAAGGVVGLRDRLARHTPQPPRAGRLTPPPRKLARTELDRVRETRTGSRSPARRAIGSAANHATSGNWLRAALAVLAAIGHGILWLLAGPRGSSPQPAKAAAQPAPKREPKAVPGSKDTAGDLYDTDQDSDTTLENMEGETVTAEAKHGKVGEYGLHPVMENVVIVHGNMFAALPHSVPNMIEHLVGLAGMYGEWSREIDVCRAFLVSQYPVHEVVHELMAAISAQMITNHDFALQCDMAYQQANTGDVERNLRPRVNEEWNNVLPGAETGVDMAMWRHQVHTAMSEVFGYRPMSPPDLRAWLRGMLPLFWQLGAQVELAYRRGGFPGAAHDIAVFWNAIAQCYEAAGSKADLVADAYEEEAKDILCRFDDPRVNEQLANYNPAHA